MIAVVSASRCNIRPQILPKVFRSPPHLRRHARESTSICVLITMRGCQKASVCLCKRLTRSLHHGVHFFGTSLCSVGVSVCSDRHDNTGDSPPCVFCASLMYVVYWFVVSVSIASRRVAVHLATRQRRSGIVVVILFFHLRRMRRVAIYPSEMSFLPLGYCDKHRDCNICNLIRLEVHASTWSCWLRNTSYHQSANFSPIDPPMPAALLVLCALFALSEASSSLRASVASTV